LPFPSWDIRVSDKPGMSKFFFGSRSSGRSANWPDEQGYGDIDSSGERFRTRLT
jgi:hypothetical protein